MDSNLKRFVNTPDLYKAYTDFLLDRIAKLQITLEQLTSLEQIFKVQGEVLGLRKLLNMRDEVNSRG